MQLHVMRLCLVGLSLFVACEGSCSACAPDTWVYWGKPLNLLDPEEAIHLCVSLHAMQSQDQLCTAMAAQRTTDPGMCAMIQAECVQRDEPRESCYSEHFAESLEECEVHAGFFDRCFKEQIQAANRLSCDDPLGRQLVPPPCLFELRESCPAMFE